MNIILLRKAAILALVLFFLPSCASRNSRPTDYQDICDIFTSHKNWYRSAKKSTESWGGNIQLPMAIMYQESSFQRKAKPKRKKVLGLFPGSRPSNAFGYSQALKGTWKEYQNQTGNRRARRDNFADSFDFIQWYINKSNTVNAVSKWDYNNQYLNYHEGHGGFRRQTYLNKNWLLTTAKRVESRAKRYSNQLAVCKKNID